MTRGPTGYATSAGMTRGPTGYRPASRFVLRTPALPFDVLPRWGAAGDETRARDELRRWIVDPAIREAVFVASPDLDAAVAAWLERPDAPDARSVERALVRYLSRMAGRATPFGLFAGVAVGAVGAVGAATELRVPPCAERRRRTRLDSDYLFEACAELARVPALREALRYTPSSSLYVAGGRLRYAEARVTGGARVYHLVAVEPSDYLSAVLERASAGATVAELADTLCADPDIEREQAEGFVGELIDAQLLVPELVPQVTGDEPAPGLAALLGQRAGGADYAGALATSTRQLEAIDASPPGVASERYRAVAATLDALPGKLELARLFQVDLYKDSAGSTLGSEVVTELTTAIDLLARIAPPIDDPLAEFRQAFTARYETREVPLVEALDEELGIGFGQADAGTHAPLLAGLPLRAPSEPERVPWSPREDHLLALADGAARSGVREIELSDDDLEKLAAPSPRRFASTLAVTAIVAARSAQALADGRFLVHVRHIDAPGGRLLGRFCHGSPEVAEVIRELVRAEDAAHPDAVLAELVHLPEGRVGNILLRPVLRAYEIPYLGASGADREHQLPVSDLLVSVVGDRVVLRSRRLGREIIPCLTAAHLYHRAQGLAIYRFLGALSARGVAGASWSWGPAASLPFLPRIRRGRLVLARARWELGRADLAPLAEAARSADAPARLRDALEHLRARRGLPRWIVLQDGDNELPVDLDNPLSADSFAHELKGRTSAALVELFPAPDELCAHGPDGRYVHELVVPFIRDGEPAAASAPAPAPISATSGSRAPVPAAFPRRFPPGSPWLYVKLYTGPATADVLLTEVVAPLVRDALAERLADRWFFIRYTDPDHHLRLRFAGDPDVLVRELLPRVHRALAPAGDAGLFWRMQLDTYEREVERYGGPAGIELAEQLFAADSDAVLALVESVPGDAGAEARWRVALRALDQLLDDLGFALPDKLAIATAGRDRLGPEYGLGTELQRRLGETYRAHRAELEALLAAPADDPDHPYAPALTALAARSARVRPIAEQLRTLAARGELGVALPVLAQSYAHMLVNRLMPAAQRAQELVLYDLLRRLHAAAIARSRQRT